jgi:myo-inositol-1(or 4)-monophosphatase
MNYSKIMLAACEVVQKAGDFIQAQAGRVVQSAIADKSLNNLVSYVDREAEGILVQGLLAILPESTVLAEEGTASKLQTADFQWIIDPLDGTTNFLHQLPFYSVSVALQKNGKTVIGIVYEVVRKELFYTCEGEKAYCNGQEIRVSTTTSLQDALVATGFPYYDFSRMEAYMGALAALMQSTRGLRRCGSAALDLAYVACGRFDAYFEAILQPWDIAAGAYLVQQAGGFATDFSGGDTYHSGAEIVACNANMHTEFATLIQKHLQNKE